MINEFVAMMKMMEMSQEEVDEVRQLFSQDPDGVAAYIQEFFRAVWEKEHMKTIKEAKSYGWRELRHDLYGGFQIDLKNKRFVKHPDIAKSKTAWLKLGRVVIDGVEPHSHKASRIENQNVRYPIYRIDQTTAK